MQFRRLFRLAAACLAALPLLAAASAHAEIEVRHSQGTTVLARTPEKVIVFDLAALDTLDALGIPVAGVPGSNVPDYLGKYRGDEYLKAGTLFEPDYEAVHAAAPDLIIVGGRSAPKFAELSQIAPTIDLTLPPDHFLDGVKRNAETLGRIFGKEAEVAARLETLDESVAAVRAKAEKAGRALIVMTNGGKVTAYGSGSRFGWLHDDLGLTPAAEHLASGTHGEAISFEFIAQTDPDWIFVIDRDSAVGHAGASAEATLDNELVAGTRAAKNGHIVHVDATRWYIVGGGLSALEASVEEVGAALGKDD